MGNGESGILAALRPATPIGNGESVIGRRSKTYLCQSVQIKLPSIGWVKYRSTREIPVDATIKQARAVKRASGWYVMLALQWDVEIPAVMPHGYAVGIDVGLNSFIATSGGLILHRPRFFVDLKRKLRLLQQRIW
jgi:putative transposase